MAALDVPNAVLHVVNAVVVVLDPRGRIVYLNEAGEALTGWALAEVQGKDVWEVLIPDHEREGTRRVFETLKVEQLPSRYENQWRRRDGSLRLIEFSNTTLQDDDGALKLIVATGIDVTERRRAEDELKHSHEALTRTVAERTQALREANELLETIFDHTQLMVAYLDRDLRFVKVNRAYAELDRRRPEDLVGLRHFDLYPSEENERLFRTALETGEPQAGLAKPFQYRHAPERGLTYWDWTAVPVRAPSGEVSGLLLTLMNVTQRIQAMEDVERHAEALAGAVREKEVLLKEVHHRVKNNLQVVSSLLSLQTARAADAARDALLQAQSRLFAIAAVHERLYNTSDLAHVDFREYVTGLVGELRASHGELAGRVRLEVDVPAIALDIEQAIPLGLIVNELVTNSLKHAFPGERAGEVRVSLRSVGPGLRLEVADDGAGLPPDRQTPPTGLGLVLVRTLAKQLGGSVDVGAAPGLRCRIDVPERAEGRVGSSAPSALTGAS